LSAGLTAKASCYERRKGRSKKKEPTSVTTRRKNSNQNKQCLHSFDHMIVCYLFRAFVMLSRKRDTYIIMHVHARVLLHCTLRSRYAHATLTLRSHYAHATLTLGVHAGGSLIANVARYQPCGHAFSDNSKHSTATKKAATLRKTKRIVQ
jgi:hypothetical protein